MLMISVSMSNGFSRSLATAAGDLSANILQILLAGFGLAAVLLNSQYGFVILKWCGVAYLIWLGANKILLSFKAGNSDVLEPSSSLNILWLRGFITSAANPKAVIFFAALFPQFIDSTRPLFPQIMILGLTYIIVDGLFLATYGKAASWLAHHLTYQYKRWVERISGASLIGAAIMLGLRKPN
jgi:threonine/homoserine/homoserine lactone efflux protein